MNQHAARKPWWRQPLVHFLVAGALIFAVDALRSDEEVAGPDSIILNEGQVTRLASLFQQSWGRPPSTAELTGVIEEHVKEEVYYREALKLGLDGDDPVIRRRLRQKLEFMLVGETPDPSEAEILSWYESNPDSYTEGPVYRFEQVYLGESADTAEAVLSQLAAGEDARALSQPIALPGAMSRVDPGDVQRIFGTDFTAALDHLDTGQWLGPVWSGFGAHLVRVHEKVPAAVAPLDAVRRQVFNDWKSAERQSAEASVYENLKSGYEISVSRPSS